MAGLAEDTVLPSLGSHENPRQLGVQSLRSVYRGEQQAVQMPLRFTTTKQLPCPSGLAGELRFTLVAPFQTASGSAGRRKGSKRALLLIHLSLG